MNLPWPLTCGQFLNQTLLEVYSKEKSATSYKNSFQCPFVQECDAPGSEPAHV